MVTPIRIMVEYFEIFVLRKKNSDQQFVLCARIPKCYPQNSYFFISFRSEATC